MAGRKTTPLKDFSLGSHRCSVDLRLEKLSMVPFFEDLEKEELTAINQQFSAAHHQAEETIYHQDERATMLRVVVHGAVKLVRHTMDGKDVLLDMLQPGEYFGNLSNTGRAIYSETARAQTDVCILSIRMSDFRSLLNDYPKVAVAVLDITADRLQSSQEKIRHLTTLTVKKRIAHILVMLSEKFGEQSTYGLLLQLPLSRKDLADMAGTSSETASRIMSDFQDHDIIKTGRQWVAISNMNRLADIAKE
ncbi:Crp/Fnr family transcriptional regulator [Fodinibius sp. SL11]|uniref:Crp/Fnr family transcriptional regulator n=1 Tax=Fodinibius sp. SL11 TaxID=3425690 RepID=UPI003F8842C0